MIFLSIGTNLSSENGNKIYNLKEAINQLNINNIKKALKTAKPDIVDISSGVEKERGVKCEEKIRNFIKYVEKI